MRVAAEALADEGLWAAAPRQRTAGRPRSCGKASRLGTPKNQYDVVIVGAGLAGLTTAYYLKKLRPDLQIVILERSGTAGGLTGDWLDHRTGPNKRLQMPMHMIFREKYRNLLNLVQEIGGTLSPLYTGYRIITGDGKEHRLEMNDWASRHLPPPLHAAGMIAKLRLPLSAKWDLFKLTAASTYCYKKIGQGCQEPPLVPNTLSFESLQLLLHMGGKARDFLETVTPSIYNSHPWYTSAPRMAMVMAGTMAVNRDSLHYHVFGKNYNAAFIDRFVARLKEMGVEIRFWTEVRRLEGNGDGGRLVSLWCRHYGPGTEGSSRYVCNNCGAENYMTDRAFCTRCGLDTTLDRVRDGEIARPVGRELWGDQTGCEEIRGRWFVTAMYPHMIARLLPIDSPLRRHPYLRSCFSARLNQTRLSIARVYYKRQVSRNETWITGTHNPTFCFNGCQSVFNNFGGEDLGLGPSDHFGDVIDVLMDVGILQDSFTHEERIARIVTDLNRVYPDADPSLVEHVSYARIQPEVLYHLDQPAITGSHRFFNRHRTGVENWYVAGCHSGTAGIGMESAVEGGMATVNQLLEDAGMGERASIVPYSMNRLNRLFALLGAGMLLWAGRGRTFRRLTV